MGLIALAGMSELRRSRPDDNDFRLVVGHITSQRDGSPMPDRLESLHPLSGSARTMVSRNADRQWYELQPGIAGAGGALSE